MSSFRCFRTRVPLIAALLAMAPLPGAGAQDPPPPDRFRTEANYVRLDAYVSKDDVPITDLRREDFEVLEDGVVQEIDAFEHVTVRTHVTDAVRQEPASVAASRAALENSRARVFVLFLDTYHVQRSSSREIAAPLVEALDGLIGEDDLVAVMTPDMSPSDLTFARKLTTIRRMLERNWWGVRDAAIPADPVEDEYRWCYAPRPGLTVQDPYPRLAQQLIDRRREKLTFDALEQLMLALRTAREERKAVIAITEGWQRFRPDMTLIEPEVLPDKRKPGRDGGVPAEPGSAGVDPRTGRLRIGSDTDAVQNRCEKDRLVLASMDDEAAFRRIVGEANRANASFYPVDPRGLATFDMPVGPVRPVPLALDRSMLSARIDTMRTLAEETDGTAIVQTNDVSGALDRVAADLSSYYLVGYYSTGPLDGRFHAITVRVKRPDVKVRARKGFQALTRAEAARLTAASSGATRSARAPVAVGPGTSEAATPVSDAIDTLAAVGRDRRLRVVAAAGWAGGRAIVAAAGEMSPSEEWRAGADVDLQLLDAAQQLVATAHVEIPPGSRVFRVDFAADRLIDVGTYTLHVRNRLRAPDTSPALESVTIDVPPAPAASGGIYLRRGQTTGNRDLPTGDLRFRRGDRLRVEVPRFSDGPIAARLLDRTGQPLPVPVASASRVDSGGTEWQLAELALTPLAPGDYVIELSGRGGPDARDGRVVTLHPFRVVP